MAQFYGTQLTADGLILKAKGETNKLIEFTKIAVGDDVPDEGETVQSLTALKSQKLEVTINSFDVLGGGISKATGIISNQGLEVGFYVREIGLFAKDPDTLVEKLYAYTYVSSAPDWLPPEGGPTLIESEIGMIAVIGNATNITANIDDTVVVATKRDVAKILGIALDDGVTEIMQGTAYVFPITNYDGFSTYNVDAWIDANPIASELNAVYYEDEAFHVNIPTSLTGSNFKMRLKKTTDEIDYFREVTIPLFSGGIVTPSITFPVNNSDGIGTSPTLSSSAFIPVPSGSQTHSQTQWQVATDSAFSALVVNVTSGTALTSYAIPADTLELGVKYYARVRYEGSVSGWSSWSGTVSFTTMGQLQAVGLLVEDATQGFNDICQGVDGNYYACGINNGKFYIGKFNSKLEKIGGKTISYNGGVSSADQELKKIIYHNGYLYAVGEGRGTEATHLKTFVVLKVSTVLELVASKNFEKTNATNNSTVSCMLTDIKADGTDIYVCGYGNVNNSSLTEAVIIRLNESLTIVNKRLIHAASNSVDRNIWASAICVEAAKVSILICGAAGTYVGTYDFPHFSVITVDRDLSNVVVKFSKMNNSLLESGSSLLTRGSIVTDGTNYYLSFLPSVKPAPATTAKGFVAVLDSSYAIIYSKYFSLEGIFTSSSAPLLTAPELSLHLGSNNDLIIGGGLGATIPSAADPANHYFAVFMRVSKSLAALTAQVGLTTINESLIKYGDFIVNSDDAIVTSGLVVTGQGAQNAFVESLPSNLVYPAYGPMADLPELSLFSSNFVWANFTWSDSSPAPTYTNNNTVTLAERAATYTLADDAAIYFLAEF